MGLDTGLTAGTRIAIYSQDGFGLGHMRRTNSIAWQIHEIDPNASILTISDSQLGQFFKASPNHDYLKLPSILKVGSGIWQAPHLRLPVTEVLAMRSQLIRSALTTFLPHIFLVDHMPHGALGELLPALNALKEIGFPTRVVLGLRDILDTPDVIQRRWHEEGAYEAIEQFYSRVLIYGMHEVYPVEEKYHFPAAISSKMRYCGYVCSLDDPGNSDQIRTSYLAGAPAGTRFIVAMAGGGADAYPMMSTLLDAQASVQKERKCILLLITGPFMPPNLIEDLHRRAHNAPVRIIESVEDTLSYISAADLVIAMAGYNTSVEVLRMKKPTILIPRSGPSAEQRIRAELFAQKHWVDMISPDQLTVELLSQKIISRFCRPFEILPKSRPNLHGVILAANQILSLLQTERQREMVESSLENAL